MRGSSVPLSELLLFGAVGGIFGLATGQLLGGIVAGLVVWAGWAVFQLRHLHDQVGGGRSTGSLPSEYWVRLEESLRRGAATDRASPPVAGVWSETLYHLSDGVVLLDPRMHILGCNRAAEELLGLQPIDQGQLLTSLVRAPQLARYLASPEHGTTLELQSPRNRRCWLQLQLARRRRLGGGLLLVRDISDVHRLQQLRRDFTANVSHELRTPLTVLLGYLEWLEEERDALPPRHRQTVAEMRQQGERMSALINQLLELAQIESRAAQAVEEPVAVAALLGEVAAGQVSERGVQVVTDSAAELWLLGDAQELHTAVANLLSNALRYSPDEGVVQLIANWHEKGIEIVVVDRGPGIALPQRLRLRERFYCIPGDARSGTGLGLAIVSHILERHQAQLHIRGEVGQGAEFCCCFPPSRSRRK